MSDDKGEQQSLMIDGRIPPSEMTKLENLKPGVIITTLQDAAELEEFTILAITDGRYYKAYMEPRAVNEDLAIFYLLQ